MPYYIAASPLVKIYLPEWYDRLEANPELIYDMETSFDFWVDTGTRSVKVAFNVPQMESNVDLFRYLTGGKTGSESTATNIYGIVAFDPQIDMVSTFDQLAQLDAFTSDDPAKVKAAAKKRDKIRAETQGKIQSTRANVHKMSKERILRAIRFNHNNLIKQWQTNEEMKLGKYPPSMSELLGAMAIKPEIEARDQKTHKVQEKMGDILRTSYVG